MIWYRGCLMALMILLPIAYKHFQIPDDQFNQVMGLIVGLLTQDGIAKVRKVRAAKKAKADG